jgi:hypothetical protein
MSREYTIAPGVYVNEQATRSYVAQGAYVVEMQAAAAAAGFSYWSGSAWVSGKPLKYWTGSSWVQKPLKSWNGSAWV